MLFCGIVCAGLRPVVKQREATMAGQHLGPLAGLLLLLFIVAGILLVDARFKREEAKTPSGEEPST